MTKTLKNILIVSILLLLVFAATVVITNRGEPTERPTQISTAVAFERGPYEATTTTTAPPPPPTTVKKKPKPVVVTTTVPQPVIEDNTGSQARTMQFTAYCLRGTMASGKQVYEGAAASNHFPLGTRIYVPKLDRTFTIEDRHSTRLGPRIDIWLPSCDACKTFGAPVLAIEVQ